jgi:hypothetical protein
LIHEPLRLGEANASELVFAVSYLDARLVRRVAFEPLREFLKREQGAAVVATLELLLGLLLQSFGV